MNEQYSLFPAGDACRTCHHYAELKEPWTTSDGAVIYGYCFKNRYNMEKGYPVYIAGGKCEDFKRRQS